MNRRWTGTDRDPTPPVPLSSVPLYRGILKGLPPTAPLMTAILGFAATLAVALDEIDVCNQTLGRLKWLIVKCKPHPLLAVRHAASLRVASLSSRLRLLPTMDQREIARAARFNSRFDGAEAWLDRPAGDGRQTRPVGRNPSPCGPASCSLVHNV
jgi:hypothetical protein